MTDNLLSTELMEAAKSRSLDAQALLHTLSTFDFTPAYEMDKRLKSNPALLAEFTKDPVGVAKREVGLVAPPGVHMHFVNEENEYFPK